jgi:hypothetical protein
MVAFIICLFLGWFGKWRYLGLLYLLAFLFTGIIVATSMSGGDAMLLAIPLWPFVEVGAGYLIGALARYMKTGRWPRDASIAALDGSFERIDGKDGPVLTWEAETPVLTAPVLRGLGLVTGICFVFMFLLMFFINMDRPGLALTVAAVAVGGLAVLMAIAVFGILMNTIRKRFVVSADGYRSTISDGRMAWTTAAGVTSGNPTAAGAALMASSNRSESQPWDRVRAVEIDRKRRRIRVKLRRRGWDVVHGPPAPAFDQVAAVFEQHAPAAETVTATPVKA